MIGKKTDTIWCSINYLNLIVFVMLSLLLLSSTASAAHTFDTKAQYQTTSWSTANPGTLSYTAGSGASLMVLTIFTAGTSYRRAGTPTFNGKSFSSLGRNMYTSSQEGSSEMWYLLLTPADTGFAYTVSIPNAATSRAISFHVSTYKSATGVSALDVNASKNAQSTNPTQSVTTTANGDVIVAGMFSGLSTAPTVTSPGSAIYSSDAGTNYIGMSQYYLQSSAGNQALGWTSSSSDDYSMQTAAFKEVVSTSTYSLSGYIINKSSGLPLNGVTVQINTTPTSRSATTNMNGYYNFSGISNGTYLISASTSGYSPNSTVTRVDGNDKPNINVSIIWAPAGSSNKLIVATNRYVILDDWTTTASSGTGFALPGATHSANSWSAINTRINATALFIDDAGSPLAGRIVTFNLIQPNNAEYVAARVNAITDAYGLANFSFDMDARNYYGNWTVKASNGGVSDNTSFIYNWWGCGIGGCESGHSDKNPSGSATINSPYLSGRDSIVGREGAHGTTCTNCHQSFDGKQGANTNGGTQHTNNPQDVHRSLTCDNTNCHQTVSSHNTNAVIGSCYSAACHTPANRADLSNKSTLSGVVSIYSSKNGSNAAFHTPNSTVPCFICHGPMHNITKPDETLRFIRNSDTESSQCKTCHVSYNRHNNGVNCTICHSDDVHAIKVFAQNATYVTLNHNSPNPARGNCTNCHQNAAFFNILKANRNAGSYTGANPPQVHIPLNHSSDRSGQKWGTFWTTPASSCNYCHGSTQHDSNALGTITTALGSDSAGGPISTGTVCSSCHNSSDSNYNVVLKLLSLPPANIPGINYPISGGMDHTGYVTDADCKSCHGGVLSLSADISEFVHNVEIGKSGGPNCISCHDLTGTAPKQIDVNVLKNSTHKNLNGASGDVNKACYACHGTAPSSGHPVNYKSPKTCVDCHTGSGNYSAVIVPEHNQIGQDVVTLAATCNSCHNNTGMYLPNAGTDGNTRAFMHYLKDVTNTSTTPYLHFGPINTSNCIICHNGAYTNNTSWGNPVNISISTNRQHTETLTSQCDMCHNDGSVTTLAYVDFHDASIKLAGATDCIGCHTQATGSGGIYAAINTASFAKHRNVNITDGNNQLTNADCTTCHTDITNMMNSGFTVSTKNCADCHNKSGSYAAPTISNHRPDGISISTSSYCSTCHNNSINTTYAYSDNASSGHYSTTTNLVKPTARTYNTACNICHNSPENMILYGAQNKQITMPHTGTGTCNECHVNGSASDLHNVSLGLPATFNCRECHTTYADRYNAPNITGTSMMGYTNCDGGLCHGTAYVENLDTRAEHNIDRNFKGTGGYTDTVYLNSQVSLTVIKRAVVTVTSRVNDTQIAGGASRIGGAEYYIDIDPGQGNGTDMAAVDGSFDALQANWEDVTATIDTNSLTEGSHVIYVRGVDIGKQWSATKSANLIVQALGYINGTVTNGTAPVNGAYVSTVGANHTTGLDGKYSLVVPAGTYIVTASKQPEFNDKIQNPEIVTMLNTTTVNIVMVQKQTGTISGIVRNK